MKQTRSSTKRSPISRIPPELLDAVFVLASDAISEDNPYRPYDPLEASRIVSHVSSFWREIALKNSSLWNQIILVNCWERTKHRMDQIHDKKDARCTHNVKIVGRKRVAWVGRRMGPEHGIDPHHNTIPD